MNYSEKENKLICMIERIIKTNAQWAENIYEDDDDPHSEMLIKYVLWGINDSCSHYLDLVLTQAPEHKLKVLNNLVLSNVFICHLSNDENQYIVNLFGRFPDLLEKESFWNNFCYNIYQNQNYQALIAVESLYDKDLILCKKYSQQKYHSIFEKFDLFKQLNEDLNPKELKVKPSKI